MSFFSIMSTSYISDLPPENITLQLSPVETKIRKEPIQAPTYAPLDVHKNPYLAEGPGSSGVPNPNMNSQGSNQGPPPSSSNHVNNPVHNLNHTHSQGYNQGFESQGSYPPNSNQGSYPPVPPYPQVTTMKPQPPHRLPSRDIPLSTVALTQDETILPNYIPKKKLTRDFVMEDEDLTEERIVERRKKKNVANSREEWIKHFQVPALLAVLYYLFQLPFITELFQKLLTWFPFLFEEGVPNLYGRVLKALLFGLAFYGIRQTTDLVSN
jgi:hypothetical protein